MLSCSLAQGDRYHGQRVALSGTCLAVFHWFLQLSAGMSRLIHYALLKNMNQTLCVCACVLCVCVHACSVCVMLCVYVCVHAVCVCDVYVCMHACSVCVCVCACMQYVCVML